MKRLIGYKKERRFWHFLHFLAVFSGIFLVMTVLIFKIISSGAYASVDKALLSATENKTFFVRKSLSVLAIEREIGQSIPVTYDLDGQLLANTDVMIHNYRGELLNELSRFSGLQYMSFHPEILDTIMSQKVINVSGQEETYRMITTRVSDPFYPEAAYLSIAINTTQLEETNARNISIISVVMFIFWLISILASLYLANWSRKPIEDSYERQKTFVENASHELRTPLTVLQNRLELLFRKPNTTILENSEHIASSLEEVRNMRLLTSHLLELARRDDGISLSNETIMPDFFDDLFLNYKLIAEGEGKVFAYFNQIEGTLVSDPLLLKQLMTILFDNAVKYTDDDGTITYTAALSDKFLTLSVSDNGFGISPKDKEKVFDRFYRVDKARTRQRGGFGLGLALAQQIVTALNGQIKIKDNTPKGTIFEVTVRVN